MQMPIHFQYIVKIRADYIQYLVSPQHCSGLKSFHNEQKISAENCSGPFSFTIALINQEALTENPKSKLGILGDKVGQQPTL